MWEDRTVFQTDPLLLPSPANAWVSSYQPTDLLFLRIIIIILATQSLFLILMSGQSSSSPAHFSIIRHQTTVERRVLVVGVVGWWWFASLDGDTVLTLVVCVCCRWWCADRAVVVLVSWWVVVVVKESGLNRSPWMRSKSGCVTQSIDLSFSGAFHTHIQLYSAELVARKLFNGSGGGNGKKT